MDEPENAERVVKKQKVSEAGALSHEYDISVHTFLGHLRRVHASNPAITKTVNLDGTSKSVQVLAAGPLAPPGVPLYYYHSKTKMYGYWMFHFWDNVMAPTMANVCPWFVVDSQEALDRLLGLKFKRLVELRSIE